VLGFLIGEALRDFRRAGAVAASAVLLTALSLATLGSFWVLSTNLGQAVAHWRDRVRIIVYLKRELSPAEVTDLGERVHALGGVASVTYVGKLEALAVLKQTLGPNASVLDELPANPLPPSLEIAPTSAGATPEGAQALIERLHQLPEAEEIAGGVEWVQQLAQWRRLLNLAGAGVGLVLGLAAISTVTTATTLVLHGRRREAEIMRLVGAPESAIRLPLLLQGMLQGLVGASLALLLLVAGHRLLAPHVEPLLTLTVGLPRLEFLSAFALVLLLAGGTALGGLGGLLARGGREP
jgi:cell division transport system permease protein